MNHSIRLVEAADAPFIVALRNDHKLNRYLSQTSVHVTDQVKWIENYKIREGKNKEYYFIIYENGERKGLYRIYNINTISFTIGSWLFESCENKHLPILVDLLMGDLGIETMRKQVMLFEIRKDNRKVIQYHQLKSPFLYNEDEHHYYYLIKAENWETSRNNALAFFGIKSSYYDIFKQDSQLYALITP